MLAAKFWALKRNDWGMYPQVSTGRMTDGTIRHSVFMDPASFMEALRIDQFDEPPVKIQEDAGRGTVINHQPDQQQLLLQYWAHANQPIAVGISTAIENHTVEYWTNLTLDSIPEEVPEVYPLAIQALWLERLHDLSPKIAAECERLGTDYVFKMRCQANALRAWFTPPALAQACLTQPLAEAPIPKDKWFSNEAMVASYSPMPDLHAAKSAQISFEGRTQQRYDDPEILEAVLHWL
jgi:hypothetical protein